MGRPERARGALAAQLGVEALPEPRHPPSPPLTRLRLSFLRLPVGPERDRWLFSVAFVLTGPTESAQDVARVTTSEAEALRGLSLWPRWQALRAGHRRPPVSVALLWAAERVLCVRRCGGRWQAGPRAPQSSPHADASCRSVRPLKDNELREKRGKVLFSFGPGF